MRVDNLAQAAGRFVRDLWCAGLKKVGLLKNKRRVILSLYASGHGKNSVDAQMARLKSKLGSLPSLQRAQLQQHLAGEDVQAEWWGEPQAVTRSLLAISGVSATSCLLFEQKGATDFVTTKSFLRNEKGVFYDGGEVEQKKTASTAEPKKKQPDATRSASGMYSSASRQFLNQMQRVEDSLKASGDAASDTNVPDETRASRVCAHLSLIILLKLLRQSCCGEHSFFEKCRAQPARPKLRNALISEELPH